MSLVDGLASVLREMTLGELALVLAAVLSYSLAINGSYSSALRSGAASVAFASAVGFTTLTPAWMSAIVFLALAVVGVAAVAGVAWALSAILGLGEASPTKPARDAVAAPPASPAPARSFAPHTQAQPL